MVAWIRLLVGVGVLTVNEVGKLRSVTLRLWTQRTLSEWCLALVSKLQLMWRADIRCLIGVHSCSHEL